MSSLIKLIKKTYQMAGAQEGKVVMGNVASLSWLQVITYALPMILLPYLFRMLGAEKFGLIAFAQAFVQYFMILTDYGFNVSATKEISLYQDDHTKVRRIFSAIMTAKIGLFFISFIILSTLVYFVPKFRGDWLVYMLCFPAVLGSTLFPVWFFQGMEKMKYIAQLNIIGSIFYAICIFTFIHKPQDYLLVPFISSCASLIVGLFGQYFVIKKFSISPYFPSYKEIQQQLEAGWNIFIAALAVNAYTTTRVFAVGMLTNNTLTGYYSIAERIANAVQTFPLYSFSQAIFPRLSNIYQKNHLKAFNMMQQIQQITITISLICLPIVFILANLLVSIVCGGNYPAAVLSVRLLIIAVFFVSANAFRVQFLLVCGETKIYSRIHMTMAVIGLPLILLLISFYSYVGAAMATVAIEGGIFTLTYFAVKRLTFSLITPSK
ncbi:MAG: flippase [Candidatus Omnitrophota bacterium]